MIRHEKTGCDVQLSGKASPCGSRVPVTRWPSITGGMSCEGAARLRTCGALTTWSAGWQASGMPDMGDRREYMRRYRAANREQLAEKDKAYREANGERRRARQRAYYAENAEQVKDRVATWQVANPDKVAANSRRFRAADPDRAKQIKQRQVAKLRSAVFDHYGWSCACCGSAKKLSIDHIGGDGREHRIALSGRQSGTTEVYRWLIDNGFPEGFQTLCMPCNTSKSTGTQCRINHRKEK